MKSLRILRAARAEANAAARRYESERAGLGQEFAAELEKVYERIERMPLACPPHALEGVRKGLLDRFPFTVYFALRGDVTVVLAVAHQSRRTDYWLARK